MHPLCPTASSGTPSQSRSGTPATLVAPRYAHLVADASSQGYLPSWRFRRRLSTGGTSQLFTLDTGTPPAGRVLSSSLQPLEGMTVSAWSYSNGWHWNGLKQTDACGSYDILAGERYSHVRGYALSRAGGQGRRGERGGCGERAERAGRDET